MSYLVSQEMKNINLNETDEVAGILRNIATILGTTKGSVPLYRDFGIPNTAVDRPIQIAKTLLYAPVKEAVEFYEPRAEVKNVTFRVDPNDPGRLIPTVEINIL